MKKSFVYFLISASTIVLMSLTHSGCNSSASYKSHLKTVDSLQTVLNELEEIVAGVDYDHHLEIRKDMMSDMEQVERYYISRGDTIPRDIALKLSEYRLIWKGYKRIESEYERVSTGVSYTKKQLETLNNDLEHNAIGEVHANRFVQEEHEAINLLSLDVKSFAAKMEQSEGKYNIQKPVIVQLADSLTKKE